MANSQIEISWIYTVCKGRVYPDSVQLQTRVTLGSIDMAFAIRIKCIFGTHVDSQIDCFIRVVCSGHQLPVDRLLINNLKRSGGCASSSWPSRVAYVQRIGTWRGYRQVLPFQKRSLFFHMSFKKRLNT